MKYLVLLTLSIIANLTLQAQSTSPENVTGKIYMRDGSNFLVHGDRPVPGHQHFDPSDPPDNIPASDFRQFDANMFKVFDVVKEVSDLNPPIGFDAWYQIDNFHREEKGMYYGWLRVWMFAYYNDWRTKKNIPSEETSQMVYAYINDPTPLCGKEEYFTDTSRYVQVSSQGNVVVDRIGNENDFSEKIVGTARPLFAPYTVGAFLQRKIKHYEKDLKDWQQNLQSDQQKLNQSKSYSPDDPVKQADEQIKTYKADIIDKKNNLKTDNAMDAKIDKQLIEYDEKMIVTMQKSKDTLSSSEETNSRVQMSKDLSDAYQQTVDIDEAKINDIRQKLQRAHDRYGLGEKERNKQAFEKPIDVAIKEGYDARDLDQLTDPGETDGKALYCYNPNYFDKSHPSGIQLIILCYGVDGNSPVQKKQREIIQQVNVDSLNMLVK